MAWTCTTQLHLHFLFLLHRLLMKTMKLSGVRFCWRSGSRAREQTKATVINLDSSLSAVFLLLLSSSWLQGDEAEMTRISVMTFSVRHGLDGDISGDYNHQVSRNNSVCSPCKQISPHVSQTTVLTCM